MSNAHSSWALVLALVSLIFVSGFTRGAVRIEIEGLPRELANNTRAYLSLDAHARRVAEDNEPMSADTVKRLYGRATEEIGRALQPYGYYSPVITSELEQVARKGKQVADFVARFSITPGPRTQFRQVNIEVQGPARQLPEIERLLQTTKVEPELPLMHVEYDALKADLQQIAYRAGFLDARFSIAELKVYPHLEAADVSLTLLSGNRYYFGLVQIEQDILDTAFIRRYVKIKSGDPFDVEKLVDLQLALTDSAYFASVDIDVRRQDAVDYRIPVRLRAEPLKPQKYTTKLGYGTDTGPRAGLGLEIRRVNRFGHQFDVELEGATRRTALGGEYRLPIADIDKDNLAFFFNIQKDEVAGADTDGFSVGVRLQNNWWVFRRQLYLQFHSESFKFGEGPTEEVILLTPGITLHYQTADNLSYTRRGFSATLDVHGGVESPLTDTTFLQGTLGAHAVLPLASRARLLLRGSFGVTSTDNFDELPPSERFYAGGDRSVRGYAFESLSPVDEDGNEIGGRYLSTGSVEVDYLLRGDLGIAAFYDIGSATRELQADFSSAVGVGLRYRTKIGMLRVDLAHPLDDDDTNVRLHLTVGPDL